MWQTVKPNLQTGDVVLLKKALEHRNNWPLGAKSSQVRMDLQNGWKIEVKILHKSELRCYIH